MRQRLIDPRMYPRGCRDPRCPRKVRHRRHRYDPYDFDDDDDDDDDDDEDWASSLADDFDDDFDDDDLLSFGGRSYERYPPGLHNMRRGYRHRGPGMYGHPGHGGARPYNPRRRRHGGHHLDDVMSLASTEESW